MMYTTTTTKSCFKRWNWRKEVWLRWEARKLSHLLLRDLSNRRSSTLAIREQTPEVNKQLSLDSQQYFNTSISSDWVRRSDVSFERMVIDLTRKLFGMTTTFSFWWYWMLVLLLSRLCDFWRWQDFISVLGWHFTVSTGVWSRRSGTDLDGLWKASTRDDQHDGMNDTQWWEAWIMRHG